MITNFQNNNLFTKKAKLPKENSPINTVLKFVEKHIQEFILDVKKEQEKTELNEDNITEKLCDVLHFHNHPLFWFQFQKIEKQEKGHDNSIDIGVKVRKNISIEAKTYLAKETFFAFEAKRLPAPSKHRKKEYVTGHFQTIKGVKKYFESGGIERFKTGKHGKKLKYACMLGYIQKENFEFWHKEINAWIDELIKTQAKSWNENDKLNLHSSSDLVSKYISFNSRNIENLLPITLYHLLIKLN